jgi:hypothetical protein
MTPGTISGIGSLSGLGSFTAVLIMDPNSAVYFSGGQVGSSARLQTEKVLTSNETVSVLSSSLPTSRSGLRGAANSGVAGYFSGGTATASLAHISNIEKYPFVTESRQTITTTVFNGGHMPVAANSGVAMYGLGGLAPDGGSNRASSKLIFSNDTASSLATPPAATYGAMAGFANSGLAAYFGGGGTSNPTFFNNAVRKILFSTEVLSNLPLGLSPSRGRGMSGLSDNGRSGYFCGGETSSGSSNVIEKLTFSSETKTTLPVTLSTSRFLSDGASISGFFGYISGDFSNSIEKLLYSNETRTISTASLTLGRNRIGAMANSGTL